jgi:hypothetical protein
VSPRTLRSRKILIILIALIVAANLNNFSQVQAASPKVTLTSIYNLTEDDVGKTFLVNITVSDVSDLLMWVFNLSWDPTVLQVSTGDPTGLLRKGVRYNIYEGPFLKSIRSTVFVANAVNNTGGTISSLAAGYLAPDGTPSGSGVLVSINFTLVKLATTTVEITGPSADFPGNGMLINQAGKEIAHDEVDGVITDQPPPPPPPIWTELWFQLALIIASVAIVLIVVTIKIIIPRRERARAREAQEVIEEEEIETDFF